jgi:hypothetical protein
MNIDEIALRSIIREEMKSVLKEVGLHDEDAGNDVRDLRSLITDWRGMKKVVWQTVAREGRMTLDRNTSTAIISRHEVHVVESENVVYLNKR